MDVWKFLTLALIFKPKTIKDGGWEHKNGFFVSIHANTALNMIQNAKTDRQRSRMRIKNYYASMDVNMLRKRAEDLLYEIESSQNNYIEAICLFGGFYLIVNIFYLVPIIWEGAHRDISQYFLVCLGLLILLIFLYFMKSKIDKANIDYFLDIEDALYQHEYKASQYKN